MLDGVVLIASGVAFVLARNKITEKILDTERKERCRQVIIFASIMIALSGAGLLYFGQAK